MARYFKIVEIDADTFIRSVGEDLENCQLIVPVEDSEGLFVAVDEDTEYEINIPLDSFDDLREE